MEIYYFFLIAIRVNSHKRLTNSTANAINWNIGDLLIEKMTALAEEVQLAHPDDEEEKDDQVVAETTDQTKKKKKKKKKKKTNAS